MRNIEPNIRRSDFFCTDCKELFSLYNYEGKWPFCPYCADSLNVEKYKPVKHGSIVGHYQIWTTTHEQKLKKLLKRTDTTWRMIGKDLGRSVQSIRSHCRRKGWEKAPYEQDRSVHAGLESDQ